MKRNNVYFSFSFILLMILPFLGNSTVHQVDMVGFDFVPDSLIVLYGDTVLWINSTTIIHTTTSGTNGVPDGLWDSGNMSPNDSFSFVFDTLGTFPYYCTLHWQLGMTGVIVVTQTSIEESESFESKLITNLFSRPNPFKNITEITYTVATRGEQTGLSELRFDIFNTAGQLVKSFEKLPDIEANAIIWDGRDHNGRVLPDGVYFGRLTYFGETMSNKILKLR